MNSKKKNKNRQSKPPNPTPPQKQEVSETSSSPQFINAEVVESVVEERVPNIVSENVAAEVKEIEESPKKPKRNRGKKKKEDEKGDREDVKIEEPITDLGLKPENDLTEDTLITPAARKKKHENNKTQEHMPVEKQEESKTDKNIQPDSEPVQHQEVTISKIEKPDQEIKSAKKKNKKKKHRNDSERSEKTEEVSCTSAFQKLLAEEPTKTVSKPDDISISEPTAKEVEVVPQPNISTETKSQETLQKHESNKNKKNNKKDKKQPPLPEESKSAEEMQSFEITETNLDIPSIVTNIPSETISREAKKLNEVDESVASSSSADNSNTKNKGKIAKPVEKKKKGKCNDNFPDDKHKNITTSEEKCETIASITSTKSESIQDAPVTASSSITEDLDDIVLVPLTEMIPDWQEVVKVEENNGPIIGCEDKNENIARPMEKLEGSNIRKQTPEPATKGDITASSVQTELKATLEEASCSAKEKVGFDHAFTLEIKSEKTLQPSQVTVDDDIRKNVPTSSERKNNKEISKNTAEISCEDPRFDKIIFERTSISTDQIENKSEAKSDKTLATIPSDTATSSREKKEHFHVSDNKKGKNRPKSPKPPKKDDVAIGSLMPTEVVQPNISHIDETTLPVGSSCPDILSVKEQQSPVIKSDLRLEKTESNKDGMECMQTPAIEKRQKSKKSPKPVVDIEVASGSKGTQQSKQNLNMEDIIIIQAEVVSDEKAQKLEMACGNTVAKLDTIQTTDDKHDSDKSKKKKKSSKPPGKNATTKEKVCLETQGDVIIPVTPNIEDTISSPETTAVELESPKIDQLSSPNEVTPDFIEYPRCSSEQLDSNNNMVIQEILHSEAILDMKTPNTPVIQSINTNSPELPTSGIKVIPIEFENKRIEEKTDLKSKVLEVNQDMEELRLSIERSLAELTSLEKTDRETETQIDIETKNKSKSDKNIEVKPDVIEAENQTLSDQSENNSNIRPITQAKPCQEPICPARKDQKGKGKSKKKGNQESASECLISQSSIPVKGSTQSSQSQDTKKEDTNKSEQKSGDAQEKKQKQASGTKGNKDEDLNVVQDNELNNQSDFGPIENFEDAMTSSVDDVNKTFEIIANEANPRLTTSQNNPEINVIAPQEDDKEGRQEKQNPVSPPKNLLGHPDIPVPSSRTDYKKEKNKPPNYSQAKVKIKDANQVQIETSEKFKQSKESQTESKRTHLNYKKPDESICVTNQNDDYVYKYSFRKVFLQCACHVCKKDLTLSRVPCGFCNLIFYCSQKHKDEDYSQHQALCFAVSTIVHLKDQKFIYADARDVTGQNYRLLRMQMIVSSEKILKRKLVPWEQEALLYPRMCGQPSCREWRQGKLTDCEGCGQISYCTENPDHLPKSHSRWCKSYNLYRALVKHQQTLGRLEPKLPTRVVELSPLPENINEVLASMYEEKIDMSDIEYAALTQLATAPLTALFCLRHKANTANGITKKSTLTVHIVGAELQFEADVLNKWEVFLLHLVPHMKELRIVLIGPDLNPSNLPLELLGKIKLCENCQQNKRRVVFGFQDKRTYHEFWASEDFTAPDLVCAFNPSIQRSSTYSGKDTWPLTINCILKLRIPFAITSYTLSELTSDLLRVQECATVGYNVVCAPKNNSFASVRPDRNFISDDEAPLLFKNHCVTVVCGV